MFELCFFIHYNVFTCAYMRNGIKMIKGDGKLPYVNNEAFRY